MNKILPLSMFLFLFTVTLVSASPVIENVNIEPSSDIWLGENAVISLNCFDDENNTIDQVYTDITGPDITLPTLYFTKSEEKYTLLVDKEYLDRTGQFDATIYCKNNVSSITNYLTSFIVSKLTGSINGINPSPAYTGDTIEIDFMLKKNDVSLSSDVVFNVSLNDQLKSLKIVPAYDSSKGWILKIDSPSLAGIYDIDVIAFYDRTNLTSYSSIDVRNSIEFSIESVDKNWVKNSDNITVKIKALEKGGVIDLDKNNLNIKINSVNAEITTISRNGNFFDVKIIAPSLSAGRYKLEAYLNHNGYYSSSISIDYIVSITGTIVDINNKAINTQMKFFQSGAIKLNLATDSYGYYSGSLPPDIYDIEINFPKSVLRLYGVSVNSFNDPVKHFYSDEFDVPGIRNAGLYDYEIDLPYSSLDIEMTYNEKNVINENNLKIFKCSNWNSGRKICNNDWTEISGEIDIVRNKVRINSTTLSAFVIGEIKSIIVDFSLDKEKYNIDDKMIIRGIVKDEDRNSVKNASVEASIKSTSISSKIITDENGIFSLEISTPKDEGKYELTLKVRKYPYREFNGNKFFEMMKSRSILINFPETIKINKGENLTQEFSLENTGQADISDLKVYFEGIPENYHDFSEIINLKSGEERTFSVKFSIPFYAKAEVSSVTLKLEGKNISQEKVFGLNIVEKSESKNVTSPTTGLASGFILPEINYYDLIVISIIALVCFSTAIILKKKRINRRDRNNVKNFLFDVGIFIKKEDKTIESKKNGSSYDKLILTEFPNFLKFSKNLKIKGGGDGKDN